jgi:hypothetical protein
MEKELYFDIVSDEWAGGLYKITDRGFYYHHTSTDLETDKTTNSTTDYENFHSFWTDFTRNKRWFTLHPLYIHPEQRQFVKEELKKVNWNVVADDKWRTMYQHQWNKVLNNPAEYYKPLG